ncbi:ALF repeat-containing protein, partial [Streptomyces formicae]|uniref:ALF repeat-containing protein n=1 Tax=Streptomyces formicae TaxID=1616117 RepID=UPI0036198AB9
MTVIAGVMASVVLGTGVASALPPLAGPTPLAPDARAQVVQAWQGGGESTKEAAAQALLGSDADVRAFLQEGLKLAQAEDERIAVLKMLPLAGKGVFEEAQKALSGSERFQRCLSRVRTAFAMTVMRLGL